MTENSAERRLAAIFSADVKGFTRLMRDDEAATISMLKQSRTIIAALIAQHRGRVVDMPGDNILAAFNSVVDAVQAAVAVQKSIKEKNSDLPKTRRMEFRIGINLGDIVIQEDRLYGDGVNIAAMLESMAEPGGICISRTAYDHIQDKLPLGFEYIGERSSKSSARPVHAYRVVLGPPDIRRKVKQWTADHIGKERTLPESVTYGAVSGKKRLVALLFCLVFGIFGAHRFYAGTVRSAKAMLYTLGGLGLWYVMDIVIVLAGELTDDEGKKITKWL